MLIDALLDHVGVQAVSPLSDFNLKSQNIPLTDTNINFPLPEKGVEYPVVGVIDSGTDRNNTLLQHWIVDRYEDYTPAIDQDNFHGTFVSGLICNARSLNKDDSRFPSAQSKIVDIVAIPKASTKIFEDDLIEIIENGIKKYPNVKVWNLSANSTGKEACTICFSSFSQALDSIQKKYSVIIVNSIGNYNKLRQWPPKGEHFDRLLPPAESVYALSVGSIAHETNTHALSGVNEPSPFSRCGPGTAHLPKPEIVHYGGNCDQTGDCRGIGIRSFGHNNSLFEDIGTSYSAPLISTLLANLESTINENSSLLLAKALLIHSAALKNGKVDPDSLKYTGFGVPNDITDIINCQPHCATLVFQPTFNMKNKVFRLDSFPITDCIKTEEGKVQCEFLMTLVYNPPVNPAAGAAYCQVNVDASLGVLDDEDKFTSQIPPDPKLKDLKERYEEYRIAHGFKWSPVKVYRREIPRGLQGERWGVQITATQRNGSEITTQQDVALIISIIGKSGQQVYNEVQQTMAINGWQTNDLKITQRIRPQIKN